MGGMDVVRASVAAREAPGRGRQRQQQAGGGGGDAAALHEGQWWCGGAENINNTLLLRKWSRNATCNTLRAKKKRTEMLIHVMATVGKNCRRKDEETRVSHDSLWTT